MHPWTIRRERWATALFLFTFLVVFTAIAAWLMFETTTAIIWGAVVGLVLGLLGSVGLLAMFVSHDTRVAAVSALRPDALVANVGKNHQLLVRLAELANVGFDYNSIKRLLTVAFDRSGMSFWSGDRTPSLILEVPWPRIQSIGLGATTEKKGYGDQPAQQLRVDIADEDGHPVTLQFAIERIARMGGTPFLAEDAVLDFAVNARARQGSRVSAARPAPSTAASTGLLPGMTAWAAGRVGPIRVRYAFLIPVPFFALVALALALRLPTAVLSGLAAVWIASQFYAFWVLIRQGRAAKREADAGYTTLNRANLALEQRHPMTGRVIRAAGEQALTDQQFAEELRR